MKAPFPYFGGKSTVASKVWHALGDCKHYIEPFFGSGAVLLSRPNWSTGTRFTETVNDKDGFIANVWRSLQFDPGEVSKWCDWPVNHCCPAGTMIATPKGLIPIEQISVGMFVWGYESGRIVPTRVLAVTQRINTEPLVSLGQLSLTGNHPVWTTQGYIRADSLPNKVKIGMFNLPVDKPDFCVVEYENESSMENLYINRPYDIPYSLCWCNNMQNQETVCGAYLQSQERKNTSRLLDTFPIRERTLTAGCGCRGRVRRYMEAQRNVLDCKIQRDEQLIESYGWGRGNTGVQTYQRNITKIFSNCKGTEISTRKTQCYVRQEAYTRSYSENKGSIVGKKTHQRSYRKNVECKDGKNAFFSTSEEISNSSHRQEIERRTQTQYCCHYHQQKNSNMCGDWTTIHINNTSISPIGCQRSIYQSSHKEGVPLQRQSLSIPITVYNFETTTNNYFAEQILVHNCDLSARKKELIKNENRLLENLINNPEWFDAKLAGYWIWAASCWIGDGLTRPHVGNKGMGVHGIGQRPHVGNKGMGVHGIGQRPHVCDTGKGVHGIGKNNLLYWFNSLSDRLRFVRVVCGEWTSVTGGDWQDNLGIVGIYFDPPYGVSSRDSVYHHDSFEVAREVLLWCKDRGAKNTYRIVISGYEEYEELLSCGWKSESWTAQGGYGNIGNGRGKENKHRERLYYSPHCVKSLQKPLFIL